MPVFLRWLLRLGPTNPIAVRLVQNGSRRNRHLYIRASYLAALIVVLLWALLVGAGADQLDYRELAKSGARAFTWIAFLQVLLICVLAPVFMGGAIAQEASPRTWEVLLTTPLTPGEIVLGNLFGRLFFVLALLFASLPLFALTQYFGGVPPTAVFASYLVAGCAALLVGALAIGLSVSRLVGKRAFFVFYVCVVVYLGVTVAIDRAIVNAGGGAVNGQGVTIMTGLNPFLALWSLLNPSTYPVAPEGSHEGLLRWMLETPVSFWCVASLILSAVIMAASTFTVRTGGLQTLGAGETGVPIWQRLLGRQARKAGEHRAPKQVWTNPIAWREAASRNSSLAKIVARWVFIGLGAAFGLTLIYLYHDRTFTPSDFRFAMVATVWGELALIALVGINVAATAISREREDGTLDLLLTTPITARAYLLGKLRGLVMYLMPLLLVPLGTLGAACLYVLLIATATPTGAQMPLILPEAAVLVPLAVIPFVAFCVMVGLSWSLKSRGTLSSVVWTIAVVGMIGGIAGLCGWQASGNFSFLGPVLAALSPASMVYASVYPEEGLASTITDSGPASARMSLAVGAAVSALVHAGLCYAILSNMVRGFDMTVRRLAGAR
ncbi:MAG: ABC transporter permease subunit [Planctomycetota bacterium]|nr:ABC transporter permease subunit [Planctomycetota bacterium]